MSDAQKLPAQSLTLKIDLSDFQAQNASKLHDDSILGQTRAQQALEFGVAMQKPGYNIYVMGEAGTGRLSMIRHHLEKLSSQHDTPPSYAYIENFNKTREPLVIELPAGQGKIFTQDIKALIENLLATFPAVFESAAYQRKKYSIERLFNQRYNEAIDKVEKAALARQVTLFRDSDNISFSPLVDNSALTEEQFTLLPQAERELFHQHVVELENLLANELLELPQWRRENAEQLKQLDAETIQHSIEPLFEDLLETYLNIDDVLFYLGEIKNDLASRIDNVLLNPSADEELKDMATKRRLLREKYLPNFIIDHQDDHGAPVIYESHPRYQNLFGRIEYQSEQGALNTSYQRICAGSLHRANGGYLILDAEKLLIYPFVWEALKRALQSTCIEIESPAAETATAITLKPGVVPLNIKIILLGPAEIYYQLQELDTEFNEMFRVLADFDDYIQCNTDSVQHFAQLMTRHAQDSLSKPLTSAALERLIEHSCRLAEHQQRLSAYINDSMEIIGEADFLGARTGAALIDKAQIEEAINARERRSSRFAETLLEEMLDGTILIDSEGQTVGKVNGLTVLEVGDSSFGAPTRITATVHPGSRGIVDIEREADLGQSIHSKGVLILSGYLGHRYAQHIHLAISANIAIEQSYGYIDGDSAAMAELCALISALTQIPVKQNFALTGSLNQYGEVQAVGGINEKIEGFFYLCKARQLTGQQGVIIPAANKKNLMLKQEVVDAVAQGLFSIYSVTHVDQALQLLTGMEAGEMDEKGNFPESSLNYKVTSKLTEIADVSGDKEEEHEEENPPVSSGVMAATDKKN